MNRLSKYRRQLVLLAVLLLLILVMSLMSRGFFTNLPGMTRHVAEVGIIACGMTLVIMTGGIDLSVGSLLGLCGIVLGYAWQEWGWGPGPALALTVAVGILGGSINGFLVTRWNLPPLVVTLATMALFRGAAMVISEAKPVSNFPEEFTWMGQGYIGIVPVQLFIWILVVAVIALIAGRTRLGRYTMAVGDNERAATFAALPVKKVKFLLYAGTGFLCALAALIFTARSSTAMADAGEGLELRVITGVVLGGTLITGGRGSVLGTFLGVLILGVVPTGLHFAGVPTVWQSVVIGVILISTAIINQRMAETRQS